MRRIAVILLLATSAHAGTMQVDIVPRMGNEPLRLDSLRYRLPSGETFSVTRLSYLLSGFALEKTAGGWVELPGQVAWMDAAGRSSVRLHDVPPGEYRAMRFAVGLDAATNGADPSRYPADDPLNPNLDGLHWSWQGGYIFLALEGYYRTGTNSLRGYSYHFARDQNRTAITLPVAVRNEATVVIDFDLAALLDTPHPVSMSRDGNSTHSRDGDAVAGALRTNLVGAFQVRSVAQVAMVSAVAPVKPLYLPAKFTPYKFTVPARFPIPALPRDNPLLVERVALGEQLFHEPLLSRNDSISCATCHDPAHAFSDPRRFSVGVDGRFGARHAMPLENLAWKSRFFWDGRAPSLPAQALFPIQDHAEMDENLDRVCKKLAGKYAASFTQAFDNADITPEKIGLALENYLLTLTSHDSRFDRAMRGQAKLTAEEQRGFQLFFTEYDPRTRQYGADCFHCHGGALFTDNQFHDNGLDMNPIDKGLGKVTGKPGDEGKFATPSLRNVAVTGAYMHDGRFQTLEEVVEHYCTGTKRSAALDPNLAKHPDGGVPLSDDDKKALVAFLKTLTDSAYVPNAPTAAPTTIVVSAQR